MQPLADVGFDARAHAVEFGALHAPDCPTYGAVVPFKLTHPLTPLPTIQKVRQRSLCACVCRSFAIESAFHVVKPLECAVCRAGVIAVPGVARLPVLTGTGTPYAQCARLARHNDSTAIRQDAGFRRRRSRRKGCTACAGSGCAAPSSMAVRALVARRIPCSHGTVCSVDRRGVVADVACIDRDDRRTVIGLRWMVIDSMQRQRFVHWDHAAVGAKSCGCHFQNSARVVLVCQKRTARCRPPVCGRGQASTVKLQPSTKVQKNPSVSEPGTAIELAPSAARQKSDVAAARRRRATTGCYARTGARPRRSSRGSFTAVAQVDVAKHVPGMRAGRKVPS